MVAEVGSKALVAITKEKVEVWAVATIENPEA